MTAPPPAIARREVRVRAVPARPDVPSGTATTGTDQSEQRRTRHVGATDADAVGLVPGRPTCCARRVEVARRDDRGEVTATTAIIVLLVVAAIAAGGIIAARITSNANNVPSP